MVCFSYRYSRCVEADIAASCGVLRTMLDIVKQKFLQVLIFPAFETIGFKELK
jgi:hypothetical protein